MQLMIDIPSSIEPVIKTMAMQSGKNESDVITLALLNYFSLKQSLGKGWQEMYDATQDFEPDFVLTRECSPEQVRQELI